MTTKRKLREQIYNLNHRIEDLEERLCPWNLTSGNLLIKLQHMVYLIIMIPIISINALIVVRK